VGGETIAEVPEYWVRVDHPESVGAAVVMLS